MSGGQLAQNPYMMTQQQYQQTQQPVISNVFGWTQGEIGAKAAYVKPGESVILFDVEDDQFFIKTVTRDGIPLPLRKFRYSEVFDVPPQATIAQPKESETPKGFVTRDEFNELKKLLDDLTK